MLYMVSHIPPFTNTAVNNKCVIVGRNDVFKTNFTTDMTDGCSGEVKTYFMVGRCCLVFSLILSVYWWYLENVYLNYITTLIVIFSATYLILFLNFHS